MSEIKYRKGVLGFEQGGIFYDLNKLPDGFVIKGDLDLSHMDLQELPDLSKVIVKGYFDCRDNQLTSLKGAPQEVGSGFDCSDNLLTSLEGAPQEVGSWFNCSNNKLTSLEGAPKKIDGYFYCRDDTLDENSTAPEYVLQYSDVKRISRRDLEKMVNNYKKKKIQAQKNDYQKAQALKKKETGKAVSKDEANTPNVKTKGGNDGR